MKSTRNIIRLVAALVAFTLIAAACGDSGSTPTATADTTASTTTTAAPKDAGPTTIRYLTFSAAPDHLADLDAMITGFETDNPDVKVDVETLPFDEYFSVLRTQIAGNDAPDAFEVNYENFVSFATAGTLADLSSHASDIAGSGYYQKAADAFALDGTPFALPESYSTVVLFYNKDLFDQAGIAYPTDSWKWADESAAAAKIAALGDNTWGFFGGIQFWEFYKTAAQNGCNFFTDGNVTIDEPQCVEALQFMLDYVNSGSQPTNAEMSGVSDGDMFLKGELGMITTGIWMFDSFADATFPWDIVVEPGNTSGGSHFFANGVAVSAASSKQDAAYRWLQYLTSSPAAAQIRVDAAWELPTLTDQSLYASYLSQEPPTNREAVLASLDNVVLPPVIVRQEEMQDAVGAAFDKAVAGDITATEALAEAKAAIEPLLG